MIKLHHIAMLLAIERAGSIRAAAKLLGRTQPAVTKALRQAEAELGAAVFRRAPNGVAVTEQGKPILRRAAAIHSELRKMEEEVAQMKGATVGSLSVTVSPLAAIQILPRALHRFRRRFPDVRVHINGGHEPMAFSPVREGRIDLVIGPEPRGRDVAGLSIEHLLDTDVIVLTGKGSRWEKTTSLADLAAADWLMVGAREREPLFRQRFTELGIPPPTPIATSDSIIGVLSMVQDSDLLCTFPAVVLEDIRSRWRVTKVPISDPMNRARIAIVYAQDRPLTPAARHFCDCVHLVAGAGAMPEKL